MKILNWLQRIDRRYLYLLMAAVVIVPLILRPGKHPDIVFPEVQKAFDVMDSVPKDKIVVISAVWGPGTIGENAPQTEAIMRHLFSKRTKFITMCWDQEGELLVYNIGKKIEKEYGCKYARDWVSAGYIPGQIFIVIKGMAKDFRKVMAHDRFRKPMAQMPAVAGVIDHRQIGAVVEITPSATMETWIAYFNMPNKIPLIYCPTAVMAAEAYPYLDSKQVNGMLNGVIGAAQYEKLLGMDGVQTDAAATSWALSCAHVYIIVLILVGNIAYALERRYTPKPIGGRRRG